MDVGQVLELAGRAGRLAAPRHSRQLGEGRAVDVRARQSQREGRSATRAVAGHPDRSTVELDQVPRDGQAEAEPPAQTRDAAVGLTEAIEHVRQEVGRDALAVVTDTDFDMRLAPPQLDLNSATTWSELGGVGQQIPDHLLNTRF